MICKIDGIRYDTESREFRTLVEDHIEETYTECDYDDMLDDVYDEVEIGDSRFQPSDILKELDPIGYRVGFTDEKDEVVCSIIDAPEEFIDEMNGEIEEE